MSRADIAAYYDRLSRWTRIAHALGYRGGRDGLSVHRALADPRRAGTASSQRLHEVLLDSLPPLVAPRVLDAGCGLGGTLLFLASRIGGTYTGLTLSRSQADVATRAARRAGFADTIQVRVQSYDDVPASSFDLVVAIESLAHSAAPDLSVRALVHSLVPGGVLAVVDDMPEPDAERSADLTRFTRGWHCPVLWDAARYRTALTSLGTTILIERDLTQEMQPRTLAAIARLERLNRALRAAVPFSGWRRVMDSHAGGLALERLYRHGLMRYQLLLARRPT